MLYFNTNVGATLVKKGLGAEAAFQDDLIAQGVNAAVADGCVFITAGGNGGKPETTHGRGLGGRLRRYHGAGFRPTQLGHPVGESSAALGLLAHPKGLFPGVKYPM